MFRNYIKIAWRNIWKNKLFSAINVISLAIGLSASFVIGLMVYYDFSFDTFHKDGDRIYRVVSEFQSAEGSFYNSAVPVPMRTTVEESFTGIDKAAYFYTWNAVNVKAKQSSQVYKDPDFLLFTEASFFEVFDYNWLAGHASQALDGPGKVVLTQNRAAKYFPNLKPEEVVGSFLTYNDSIETVVTGVVANFKERTDLIFEEFISLPTAAQTNQAEGILKGNWDWTNSSSQLFLKLNPNADLAVLNQQLKSLSEEHQSEDSKKFGQFQLYHLQPLADLHFNADYGKFDFSSATASKGVLTSLIYIALFLIALGCFNFINLNTAQASQRAKEIGIRKTLGSSRSQLVFQFLGETLLLTLMAAMISIFLAVWLFEVFKEYIPQGLKISLVTSPVILSFIVLLLVSITLVSGLYPGLVLSGFKPISVLKGSQNEQEGKSGLRKVLTVLQFAVAQVFIISTLLVGKQIHFMITKDMGFKKDAVAYVSTPWHEQNFGKKEVLYNKLKALPQLEEVSIGGMPPASFSTHSSSILYQSKTGEVKLDLEQIYGDTSYLKLYGIELLAGRSILNDTIEEYVINETAMRALGFKSPEEALQERVLNGGMNIPIVGVMRDFNQRSLESSIKPMAFTGDMSRSNYSQFRNIHFSFPAAAKNSLGETLEKVKASYLEVYPDQEVEVHFVDESISRFYQREQRLSKLLNWATGLSVVISCLGLFGLVIYTTNRRTKEIGIRKVLGASLLQLNLLLCKEFLILVLIAFVLAAPVAAWFLQGWLQDFAYRTNLSWWIFALSAFGMIALALLIMSVRTLATAMKNPVKALRTE